MTKSLTKIFELYPVFKCISKADTSSLFIQTSDNSNEIFKIINGICNTSSQLVWLIDASLSIVPIDTTISTYNLMVDIIKKSEWEDYSFEQLNIFRILAVVFIILFALFLAGLVTQFVMKFVFHLNVSLTPNPFVCIQYAFNFNYSRRTIFSYFYIFLLFHYIKAIIWSNA